MPEDLSDIARKSQWSPYGLTLLGTDACGEKAVPLECHDKKVPQTRQVQHTLDRIGKAKKLANHIMNMVLAAPPAGAKQAAMAITRCTLAHALDYDAGVLPSIDLMPHAIELDECIAEIIALVADIPKIQMTGDVLTQATLPARCAGLQIDLPSQSLPLARAARLLEDGPAVREAVTAWRGRGGAHLDGLEPKDVDGVAEAVRGGLRAQLHERGIRGLQVMEHQPRKGHKTLLSLLVPSHHDGTCSAPSSGHARTSSSTSCSRRAARTRR